MKRIVLVLILLALPLHFAVGQSPVDGADFGVIVSKDSRPAFAYAIGNSFDVQKIGGSLFHFIKASVLYSDRAWPAASETYVLRAITGREAHWKKAYVSLGAGPWTFINTNGGDHAQLAFALSLGFRTGPLDAHLGGEIVSFQGADVYYLSAGLVIAGL